MSGGERPIGAAKGKQSDTEAHRKTPMPPPPPGPSCPAPPPPLPPTPPHIRATPPPPRALLEGEGGPERLRSGHRGCESGWGRLLAVGNAVGGWCWGMGMPLG